MVWWQVCLVALSVSMMFATFAVAMYVAFKFAALAISLDINLTKVFQITQKPQAIVQPAASGVAQDKPSAEPFVPYNEEEAFLQEKIDELRGKGLSDQELEQFIRQAVGTDIGSQSNRVEQQGRE